MWNMTRLALKFKERNLKTGQMNLRYKQAGWSSVKLFVGVGSDAVVVGLNAFRKSRVVFREYGGKKQ